MLAERLDESDHVAMVTYAGGTEVVLASTNGEKKATSSPPSIVYSPAAARMAVRASNWPMSRLWLASLKAA
jgi:hypothetical protein